MTVFFILTSAPILRPAPPSFMWLNDSSADEYSGLFLPFGSTCFYVDSVFLFLLNIFLRVKLLDHMLNITIAFMFVFGVRVQLRTWNLWASKADTLPLSCALRSWVYLKLPKSLPKCLSFCNPAHSYKGSKSPGSLLTPLLPVFLDLSSPICMNQQHSGCFDHTSSEPHDRL